MKRDLPRLEGDAFDVLIIGGGIYGACIALAAASRGLEVALIDKGDFGQATSSNSQKIIHGGLRYLQHLNLKRMRESIRARRQLMAFAPHLVRPLKCIVPTRGYGLRSRSVLSVALGLNDLVAWDRNRGLDGGSRLPRGHTVSASQCVAMIPELDPNDVSGGAVWYDAIALNTERLTLGIVQAASTGGAVVANYVQAAEYLVSGSSVGGARALDVLTGRHFEICSKLVVNAAGPWAGDLAAAIPGLEERMPSSWALATGLLVNRPLFGECAVGLSAGEYSDDDAVLRKGTRDLFFVPWRGGTIIGTFYERFTGSAESCRAGPSDIDRMLGEINDVYPGADLGVEDIGYVYAGLLPMSPAAESASGDIQLVKHTALVDSAAVGSVGGLLSLVGVKYTTAPQVAEHIVHLAMSKLGRRAGKAGTPFRAGTQGSAPTADRRTDADRGRRQNEPSVTADVLRDRYGSALGTVMEYCSSDEAQQPIDANQTVLAGEVTYAVREEMAQRLSDVVFRRTELGTFCYPGYEALERCARIMSKELRWTRERMIEEIEATENAYSALVEAGSLELDKRRAGVGAETPPKLRQPWEDRA